MSLLQMSAAGSVLIVCITILRTLAQRHLPRQTFSILWLVAALRLVLPVSIPLPVNLPFLPRTNVLQGPLPVENTAAAVSISETLPDSVTAAGSEQLPAGANQMPLWEGIWLIVSVFLALGLALLYLRWVRRFCTSLPDETPCVRLWLAQCRLLRPLRVRRSDLISSPLTYGVLRPVILLPKEMDDAALPYVLTHEYIHIRRFDGAAKMLFTAALCLHWWNPLVWLMVTLANRDMELSCDAQVLHRMGKEARAAYARALIGMEERRMFHTFSSCSFSKASSIQERIEAIMKYKESSILAVVLAVALTLCSITAFATPNENSTTPSTEDVYETSAGETEHESGVVVLDGEIGQTYVIGDLIFEIVSDEEIDQALSTSQNQTRASTGRWSIDLTGDSLSKAFAVTSSYPYAKVWIKNNGTGHIIFTITQGSKTGTVVTGSEYELLAGKSVSVYSTNKWSSGTYYANFTSGKSDMVGVAACRVASTIAELDI